MIKIKKQIAFVSVVLLVTFVLSFAYISQQDEPNRKSVLFLTTSLDQTYLLGENSSYELHRAAEHFSNII